MENNNIEIVICDSNKKDTQSLFAKLIDFNYKLDANDYIIIDISNLNSSETSILEDAINPEIGYLDIDMFFTNNVTYPIFGNDFKYTIEDNKIIGKPIKKEVKHDK